MVRMNQPILQAKTADAKHTIIIRISHTYGTWASLINDHISLASGNDVLVIASCSDDRHLKRTANSIL